MYKLYAKVKSERGEDGQGGNDFLLMEINYGYNTIMRLLVKPTEAHGGSLQVAYTLDEEKDGWKTIKLFKPGELPELNSAKPLQTCPRCRKGKIDELGWCDNCAYGEDEE